jgi:hypothetical protein
MIARVAWIILLLVIGLATAGLQLDRQSGQTHVLAPSVPGPFRASASHIIAESALRSGQNELALNEAERLVRKRPLPAEHLRLLAQAQIASGDLAAGSVAVQVAAQRGWRDRAAQEAMLRVALATGEEAEAARRYLALLLRSQTEDALLIELGPQVFERSGSEAVEAVANILAGSTRWHSAFLNRALRVIPPSALAAILKSTSEKGVQFDCAMMTRAVRLLARDRSLDTAQLQELEVRACSGPAP